MLNLINVTLVMNLSMSDKKFRFFRRMANFLKDLPCRNAENFTKINPDTCHRSSTSKKSTYIPVKDIPAEQVIVTEKTNILLR